MKVWKIKYFFCGDLAVTVALAKTMKDAIGLVVDGENTREEDISECVEVTDQGKVLTWHQP